MTPGEFYITAFLHKHSHLFVDNIREQQLKILAFEKLLTANIKLGCSQLPWDWIVSLEHRRIYFTIYSHTEVPCLWISILQQLLWHSAQSHPLHTTQYTRRRRRSFTSVWPTDPTYGTADDIAKFECSACVYTTIFQSSLSRGSKWVPTCHTVLVALNSTRKVLMTNQLSYGVNCVIPVQYDIRIGTHFDPFDEVWKIIMVFQLNI